MMDFTIETVDMSEYQMLAGQDVQPIESLEVDFENSLKTFQNAYMQANIKKISAHNHWDGERFTFIFHGFGSFTFKKGHQEAESKLFENVLEEKQSLGQLSGRGLLRPSASSNLSLNQS